MPILPSFLQGIFGKTPEPTEELIKALPPPTKEAPEAQAFQVSSSDIANIQMMGDSAMQAEGHRGLDYDQLKAMARVPLVASIVQTRINQIAEFSRPAQDGDDIGFQIRLKDRGAIPSDDDLSTIQDIYAFIQSCGDNRIDFESNFEAFLRMLVRDSLVYDQACFEVVRSRGGQVAGFLNVDSSTIRRSRMSQAEREAGRRDPEGVHYVQVVKNKVSAQYGAKELCFGIRRPRSELRYKGYGFPELEEVIPVMTNLLNAEVYNASNFTNGISVSGIVAVKTKMHPQLFRAFRREFYSMLSGAHNSKKTPLIQLDPDNNEDLKALNLSQSNAEMEFEKWINYNIRQLCAIFQIDPMEVGFNFGEVGVKSTLNQRDPSEKVLMSKEKGLRPLLRAIESWINKYIVNELDDRFELVFTGMDVTPADDQLKMDVQKVGSFMTVNEMRAQYDLPPLEGGDVILNQVAAASGVGAAVPAAPEPPKPEPEDNDEPKEA
jgi:hypothetical protein